MQTEARKGISASACGLVLTNLIMCAYAYICTSSNMRMNPVHLHRHRLKHKTAVFLCLLGLVLTTPSAAAGQATMMDHCKRGSHAALPNR